MKIRGQVVDSLGHAPGRRHLLALGLFPGLPLGAARLGGRRHRPVRAKRRQVLDAGTPPSYPLPVTTITLNWRQRRRRKLIGVTIALYAPAIAATALYFVPELIAFADSPNSAVSPAEWSARGRRWQRLSWVRGAVMYIAFIPLLLALATPASTPEGFVPARRQLTTARTRPRIASPSCARRPQFEVCARRVMPGVSLLLENQWSNDYLFTEP